MKRRLIVLIVVSLMLFASTAFAGITTCMWTDCPKTAGTNYKLTTGEIVQTPDLMVLPAELTLNTDFVLPLTNSGKALYGKSAWGQGIDYTVFEMPNLFMAFKVIDIKTLGNIGTNIIGPTVMEDALGLANKYLVGLNLPAGLVIKGGPSLLTDLGHGGHPMVGIHFNIGYQF